jgi:plasmid stabilization system protein ParE
MRLFISKRADADINSIWNHIAKDNPATADRVESKLHQAIDNLVENPSLGHFRDDVADRRYRFWCEYSYLIVYRVTGQILRVVRVIHGARDMSRPFPH